ncbi:MAG: glycosyltransferase family 4 protein [Asgard group archaeon]|nr:glycosyltransferase family 4 protein [Asgard group archaeon]
MRILIVLHKAKKKGGAVLQNLKMADAFKDKGNMVSIFAFDSLSLTKNPIVNFKIILKSLKSRIEFFKPTIILSTDPIITSSLAILASRKKNIPIFIRIGAVYDSFYAARIVERISPERIFSSLFYFLKYALNRFSRLIFKKISLVVFNSQFLKKKYYSIAPHSIVIYNGIEKPIKQNVRTKLPIELVYVGRIEPRKSIELIIESLNILNEKKIKFKFSIIGNTLQFSSYWKKISQLIVKYDLVDKIDLIGEIDNKTLPSLLSKHDILLFSTDERNFPMTEGLPNVVLEGMSNGLAIIATPVAGLPEIINKSNGFLFEPKEEIFAEKIIFLMENKEIMQEMKLQNIVYISNHFLIQNTVEKYLLAFKKHKV